MGMCHGKETKSNPLQFQVENSITPYNDNPPPKPDTPKPRKFSLYMPSPLPSFYKNTPFSSSAISTPLRIFKGPFPPPSPAKHIKSFLARRHSSLKLNEDTIEEGCQDDLLPIKDFGFLENFDSKYVLGEEIGRGHFGYTCSAMARKGELKGEEVAVKVIPKGKVVVLFAALY